MVLGGGGLGCPWGMGELQVLTRLADASDVL